MLRLLGIALGLLLVTCFGGGAARADDCQYAQGQQVDVQTQAGWRPGLILNVDTDLCGYTIRLYRQRGEDNYDPYGIGFIEEQLRPNQLPLPYDHPGACPYAVNDVVDAKNEDDDGWHRASVVSVDADTCDIHVAPISDANEVDTDNASDVSYGDIRDASIAPPSAHQAAAAKQAEMCQGGDTADNTTGDDPELLMRHGVAADLDKRTGKTSHLTFEKIQAGRSSVIGESFIDNHPDAVSGDAARPYRITVKVCTDGQAQLPPLHFAFEYVCYADAFGEGICDQTASNRLQ